MYRNLVLGGILSWMGLTQSVAQRPADVIAADTLDPQPVWATEETAAFLSQPRGFCGSPPALPGDLTSIRLLAWRRATRADGRSVDSGFWWGQGVDPEGRPFWIFAVGYRVGGRVGGWPPPASREALAGPDGWQLAYVCDAASQPLTIERTVPTTRDAAMRAPAWIKRQGPAGDGAAVIRERTWAAILGTPPREAGRPAPVPLTPPRP